MPCSGRSAAGAVAACAPPARDNNPAAPNTGTALLRRLRFKVCFARAIGLLHSFEQCARHRQIGYPLRQHHASFAAADAGRFMALQRNPSQIRSLLSKCRSRQRAQGPSGPSAGEVQSDGQRRARLETLVKLCLRCFKWNKSGHSRRSEQVRHANSKLFLLGASTHR